MKVNFALAKFVVVAKSNKGKKKIVPTIFIIKKVGKLVQVLNF